MGHDQKVKQMRKILKRLEAQCQGGPPVEQINELQRLLCVIAPRYEKKSQSTTEPHQ
jgi:hypothetical protein